MSKTEVAGGSEMAGIPKLYDRARMREVTSEILKAPPEEALAPLWDAFWAIDPEGGILGADLTGCLVPIAEQRNATRILCVGNGMTLEAHALAAAGFRVDSLDISRAANTFLRELRVSKDVLESIVEEPSRAARTFLRELKASKDVERIAEEPCSENSRLPDIYEGDIRTADACSGPYDIVIARRLLYYYDFDGMDCFLDALGNRLAEAGLLVIEGPYSHQPRRRKLLAWLKDQAIPTVWNCNLVDGELIAPSILGRLSWHRKVAWVIRNSG
jgi:hypothetical protein